VRPGEFGLRHPLGGERGRADGTVPVPFTTFVGREREVAQLIDLLRTEGVRLVTLTGPGGTGKTRLAWRAAQVLGPEYADGVAFVDLTPVRDPDLVAPSVARVLGLGVAGDRDVVTTVADGLGDRHLLLILDNFEQVVGAAVTVARLLGACPRLRVLATSRVFLRVSGEHVVPVPPLGLPEEASTDSHGIAGAEAVRLFVGRARAARPDFALTEEDAPAVAAIVRRLDGLPLAIELAAARVAVLPPRAILARLEPRLPLLTGGPSDAPLRQRTMRDAIAWSYDLLSSDEQTFFRRLAVFAGGFGFESAEAVLGAGDERMPLSPASPVLDGISSLVAKSLVRPEPGPGGAPRYAMLETVREFGLERLGERGEATETKRRLAEWAMVLARASVPGLRGPDQRRWLDRLAAEHANLRTALGWLADVGEIEDGAGLAAALWDFWLYGGHPGEGRAWLDRFLAEGTCISPVTRAATLWATGMLALLQGDFARAESASDEGLPLARQIEEPLALAHALHLRALSVGMSHHAVHPGDIEGERAVTGPLYAEALELFRAHGDWFWTAWVLTNQTFLEADPDQQVARYEEALALFRAIGHEPGTTVALSNLGEIATKRGMWAAAANAYSEALTLCWRHGDRWTLPSCLECLAEVAILGYGQAERAVRLLEAASALRTATGYPPQSQEVATRERVITESRRRLGSAAFDAAREAGRALSDERAVAEALEVAKAVPGPAALDSHGLTPRERDVLRLLVEGHSDRQIADMLSISPRTAGNHVASILTKLGVEGRTAAATLAIRHGLT
jgi:predicted ATPase/DNA-binding CsgD family transcriptional regulator